MRTLALCESSREEALASISQFLSPRNPYQVCSMQGRACLSGLNSSCEEVLASAAQLLSPRTPTR